MTRLFVVIKSNFKPETLNVETGKFFYQISGGIHCVHLPYFHFCSEAIALGVSGAHRPILPDKDESKCTTPCVDFPGHMCGGAAPWWSVYRLGDDQCTGNATWTLLFHNSQRF